MDSLIYQDRLSESPYVELVMHGLTIADETLIRPAASHWHLVFSRQQGRMHSFVVGPWTNSGIVSWKKDAEILWIRFKLGTFMPHLPPKKVLNSELTLAEASSKSFWLKSSAWEQPDFYNVDTFVNRLVREELLVRDPVVNAALENQLPAIPLRTVRHRFLQVTGQPQNRILQLQRAQQAMTLLQQGNSILDVVAQVGYADQPHLTRSMRHFFGYTPGKIAYPVRGSG
jgi:AraC-like DNA-binding protein